MYINLIKQITDLHYCMSYGIMFRRDEKMEISRLYVSSVNPHYADPEQSKCSNTVEHIN